MARDKVYDEPSEVAAEKGMVLVDGPDAVAVALTPDAALETADRLTDSAVLALGQKRIAEIAKDALPDHLEPK